MTASEHGSIWADFPWVEGEPLSFADPYSTPRERVYDAVDSTTLLIGGEVDPVVDAVLRAIAANEYWAGETPLAELGDP